MAWQQMLQTLQGIQRLQLELEDCWEDSDSALPHQPPKQTSPHRSDWFCMRSSMSVCVAAGNRRLLGLPVLRGPSQGGELAGPRAAVPGSRHGATFREGQHCQLPRATAGHVDAFMGAFSSPWATTLCCRTTTDTTPAHQQPQHVNPIAGILTRSLPAPATAQMLIVAIVFLTVSPC